MAHPPSAARQRMYIADNAAILDKKTMITIMSFVMMEVGKFAPAPDGKSKLPVVLVDRATSEVSIDLKNIHDDAVILHIYNIVSGRRAQLDEPAHAGRRAPPT